MAKANLPRLRIVVTGLVGTFPLGGAFWDYLQYALGLSLLGHEVLYLEDTARWCYDPEAQTFVESGSSSAAYLARELPKLSPQLGESWFFRDITGSSWGKSWEEVVEFCRSADLFLNISNSCQMRDEYFEASRVVFIDSDPMYTQALLPEYAAGKLNDDYLKDQTEMMLAHDVFFSFGENINSPECLVPRMLVDWIPTRQPIVNECFASAQVSLPSRRRVLTTVMSWEPAEKGPVVEGVKYTGKSTQFLRFIDLPRHAPLPFEIAMSGPAPRERLEAAGWSLIEGYRVSHDPWIYRDYLANSFGEWSVAKDAYVRSRSGWFSCRSACYLALGVPVVVQDTGFGCALPKGEGILSFSTTDEAQAAVESIAAAPHRHAQAAREIAREYFDARRVLSRLIELAMSHENRLA